MIAICRGCGQRMIAICRGCITGAHCGAQITARIDGGLVRCQCVICEWVSR